MKVRKYKVGQKCNHMKMFLSMYSWNIDKKDHKYKADQKHNHKCMADQKYNHMTQLRWRIDRKDHKYRVYRKCNHNPEFLLLFDVLNSFHFQQKVSVSSSKNYSCKSNLQEFS